MAITREAIALYLHGQFSNLSVAIDQASELDDAEGYGRDIDNVFRELGVAEADLPTATATDSQRKAVLALAEYFALNRFWRQMGDRFQHQADDVIVIYKDQVAAVERMMNSAAQRCAALGYVVDGRSARRVHFQVF